MDRIEALIAPGNAEGMADRSDEALRVLKAEAVAVENSVSYYRRLAQGRIEILEAEQRRRAEGGSVADLIEALPQILGGTHGRSTAANSRFVEPDLDYIELEWPDGRQHLVTDDGTLASLPMISDAELGDVMERLQAFERELSDDRRRLHTVIDAADHEIAVRAAAGI